uniref:Uncharacterized protein n=1 Tax=Quercus lobata TaxID=97700 RepID=A0A7N2MP47_QUELO
MDSFNPMSLIRASLGSGTRVGIALFLLAEESVCHALWECPLATNVWALVKGKLQKSSAVVQDFHSLARQMEDKLTGKEMDRMGNGCLVHLER